MPDFTVRSDSVNVEQIMDQIRARIREKRGVDYTEQQIQEMAAVKLEKFLDPRGVRSDLLDQFRRVQPPYTPPELPNYAFEENTLFDSHRGSLRFVRRLLRPILKLLFNPNPLIQALNIQSRLNTSFAEREAKREAARHAYDQLHYEVLHNLVTETTRLGIEVKNLKMQVESLTSRLEFNERRARALESAVVYKAAAEDRLEVVPVRETRAPEEPSREREREREVSRPDAGRPPAPAAPGTPGAPAAPAEGPGQRSRRRRRRRGRRGTGSVATMMNGQATPANPQDPSQAGEASAQNFEGPDVDGPESDDPSESDPNGSSDPGPSDQES